MTTAEEEDGSDEIFDLLLEGSLMTEQTPAPDAEAERAVATDYLSVQPLVVSMEEIIKNLGLTEKQVSALAELIGIPADEMKRMEITAKNSDKNLVALMPDGAKKNFAELLNLVENGQLFNRREAVTKIADMLGLTKTASAALLEKLGIFSFEIFSETAQPKTATAQTSQGEAPQGESATPEQGKVENKPPSQSGGQNTNNNNAEGKTLPTIANETGGDSAKNALNQTAQTAANVAEAGGLKAPVASASKALFQPFTHPDVMEDAKAVMSRIVEKASIISFPNRTRARISLSPPSLGFVNIEISMRGEGANARITVESHAVKQIVEQNIHQLKATFEQQGIKVDGMSVSVSEQGGNSSDSDARSKEAQSAFSGYAAEGGGVDEENPEDDAPENERGRKKTGSHYVLDIKV